MPKQKTKRKYKQKPNKSVTKRVKVSSKGKIMYHKTGRRHLMSTKNAKKRRKLRRVVQPLPAFAKTITRLLAGNKP